MTSRTEESRAARSSPYGTSNGTRALASDRFARTIRWATAASVARNARAISSVVSPPSSRRVSAMRASGGSTGWQAVKISRSRSSSMSSGSPRPAGSGGGTSSRARPTSASLRAYVSLRRMRSIARCLAVAMSQAPGLSGTPDSGHCSSAAIRASCASSSAMPTSRTMRVTPAMMRADSLLKTASTVSVAFAAVTATHQSSRPVVRQAEPDQCGSHISPDGGSSLVDLADLGGDGPVVLVGLQEPLGPLQRLGLVLGLDEGVAADDLLALGERSVGVADLAAGPGDPGALGGGLEPGRVEHDARLGDLLQQGAHALHQLGAGALGGGVLLVDADQGEKARHGDSSVAGRGRSPPLTLTSNGGPPGAQVPG